MHGKDRWWAVANERSSAQVISGVPYLVSEVGWRPPAALSDFAGAARFIASHGGSQCEVAGVGAMSDEGVRFTEKAAGSGKDVRVWQVTYAETDGSFQAEPISAF